MLVANKSDLPGFDALRRAPRAVRARWATTVVECSAKRRRRAARVARAPASAACSIGQSGMGKIDDPERAGAAAPTRARRDVGRARRRTPHDDGDDAHTLPDGAGGGWIVDSPGMKAFGIAHADAARASPRRSSTCGRYSGGCRFRDCRHDREPGCAVQATRSATARSRRSGVALLHALVRTRREGGARPVARRSASTPGRPTSGFAGRSYLRTARSRERHQQDHSSHRISARHTSPTAEGSTSGSGGSPRPSSGRQSSSPPGSAQRPAELTPSAPAPLASTMPVASRPARAAHARGLRAPAPRRRPRSRRRSRTTSAVSRTGTQSSSRAAAAPARRTIARAHDRRRRRRRRAAPPTPARGSAVARYRTAPIGPGSTANQNRTANTWRYASTSPRSIASLATSCDESSADSRRATRASARRAATTSPAWNAATIADSAW